MTMPKTLGALLLLGGLAITAFLSRPGLPPALQAADRHGSVAAQHRHDDHEHEARTGTADDPQRQAAADHDHDHDQDAQADVAPRLADHAGDDHGHDADESIRLSPAQLREFGIPIRTAGPGSIAEVLRLSGEVVYNADRIAHVSPTVSGIVKRVAASVGDRVEAGETLAVLASRELAAARSDYLAALARLALARENLSRDRRLFADKVGTERAVLEARQVLREAEIARAQAENALYALGYDRDQVARVDGLADTALGEYALTAPLSGIVTRRHITVGELVGREGREAPFVVADLSSVWVDLTVYQGELGRLRAGRPVRIQSATGIPEARGVIAFVSPALDETTRTATARVVLDNPGGHWRPGLFVSARVETGAWDVAVRIPASAITELDGETVVFVQGPAGFQPRPVHIGRRTSAAVEILAGLTAGESYAADRVLVLKAEADRAALEHAGHVH